MSSSFRRTATVVVFLSMTVTLPPIRSVGADDHIVKLTDLHRTIVNASQERQTNLATVQSFFSSESARKALSTNTIRAEKIEDAIALLSDDELAGLAARAQKIQKDFTAGALNNQEITYIIIALATAVVILVIVAAR